MKTQTKNYTETKNEPNRRNQSILNCAGVFGVGGDTMVKYIIWWAFLVVTVVLYSIHPITGGVVNVIWLAYSWSLLKSEVWEYPYL